VLTFSSFGLSEVDADTGSLSLTPGLGFNGAVVTADDLEMIVRALKTSGRAEISSAPRILVNDNEEGMLESVLQSPYSSVNASDTVATTSFGGFADAGTMINVTPHISEGGYLQLDYTIELSSFSGQQTLDEESGIIPPPRQKNTVQSVVTIPSGSSIIVGGLNRRDLSESIQRVPLLGQIPILEYLFSSRQFDETESTFFVFVRPTILDDEDFRDLRYLSQISEAEAKIDPGFPQSEPMLMEPTGR
jgi:general secretion pathway protein D